MSKYDDFIQAIGSKITPGHLDDSKDLTDQQKKHLHIINKFKKLVDEYYAQPVMSVLRIASGISGKDILDMQDTGENSIFKDVNKWSEAVRVEEELTEIKTQRTANESKLKAEREKEEERRKKEMELLKPPRVRIEVQSPMSSPGDFSKMAEYLNKMKMEELNKLLQQKTQALGNGGNAVTNITSQELDSLKTQIKEMTEAQSKMLSEMTKNISEYYNNQVALQKESFTNEMRLMKEQNMKDLDRQKEKQTPPPDIVNKQGALMYLLEKGKVATPQEISVIDYIFNNNSHLDFEWISHPLINGSITIKSNVFGMLVICQDMVKTRIKKEDKIASFKYEILYTNYAVEFGNLVGNYMKHVTPNRYQITQKESIGYRNLALYWACVISDMYEENKPLNMHQYAKIGFKNYSPKTLLKNEEDGSIEINFTW